MQDSAVNRNKKVARTKNATVTCRRDGMRILEILQFGTIRCAGRPDGESVEHQLNE